jgi:hypothetical protein
MKSLLLFALISLVIFSSVPSSAIELGNTTEAPAPTPAPVTTDSSICDIGYIQGLSYTVNATTTFIMSVNPCATSLVLPRQPANANDKPPPCGVGFAGWTEDQNQVTLNKCMYLYTKNYTTTSSLVTMYSNGTNFLTITWDCTGLEGDIDKTQVRITALDGTHSNRTITIQTKGCIRPPDDKVQAGVIVAIVVVVVFVLAVIIAVVKAKCFGSTTSGAGISSFGSGSQQHRKFEANNITSAAVQQGAYQQMP